VEVEVMSSVNGEHLNCDLDPNDPNYVCIGHDGAKGVYKLELAISVEIYNQEANDRAIIMAHISRPSHNHRLLNSQVEVSSTRENYSLSILIRKEAPCDILLFLELWMTSKDEPFSFEAYGSIPVKHLIESKREEPSHVALKDVSGTEQGHLYIQPVVSNRKEPIDLLKTCSHPGSLTNTRNKFQVFLKSYHDKLIEEYKKARPGDNYHWYTTVQCPHEQVALGTIVYMTRHVSFPREGSDHIWLLSFGLAWMEVFKTIQHDLFADPSYWRHGLSNLERAKVINYMFTLPFTGSTYVVDRTRGSKGHTMDTDIWSFLRTRPLNSQVGASFDCEDASLYMMESIYVFKNTKFELGILREVQQTLVKEYKEWFTLCMLKVQGTQYEAHAVVVLDHLKGNYSIVLEGTCLTSGVWNDTEDENNYYQAGDALFFGELYKLNKSIAWKDMIQYSAPRVVTREDVLYKTPITAVSISIEGQVEHRVFKLDETMNDAMYPSFDSDTQVLEFKDHPLEPPEFQPISWFDCTTVPRTHVTEELNVYQCACEDGGHDSCWLYYTSIEFYEKHKTTISQALSNEKYKDVQIFNAGREVCFVRICVCRVS
jgi:hypothetical protein